MTLRAYGSLFGVRHGAQPPRLLGLHGWGRSREDFDRLLSGYDAIALDLPGFGSSPVPEVVIGAAGYAEVVESVMGELKTPVVVVGHSFGGRVAVALASAHPELVAGLVLVGVPLLRSANSGGKPAWRYRLIRRARSLGLISEDRLEQARRRYGSLDYRSATGVMREVLVRVINESYEEELRRIECPVRMVWGELDSAAPVMVAEAALKLVADGALDVVEGAGHDVHLTHPERVRAAIDGLLR